MLSGRAEQVPHACKQLVGTEIVLVALLGDLLLGLQQFAQELSSERCIAGQHDPFNDFDGVAGAGDDLGAAAGQRL